MKLKIPNRKVILFVLLMVALMGCGSGSPEEALNSAPVPSQTPQSSPMLEQDGYEFPSSIDPQRQYMFYLHGKIIEDQGLPAISEVYGEYEYEAILEELSRQGFVVISEVRAMNTDATQYARKVVEQVNTLLDAGVLAKDITVVGASKGAWITVYVSHSLANEDVNFVLLAVCHPDALEVFLRDQIRLTGNVLSIYDSVDEYAGSCQELFSFSEGKGIAKYEEIVLDVGTGHGILYKPLDAWLLPTVQWANHDR